MHHTDSYRHARKSPPTLPCVLNFDFTTWYIFAILVSANSMLTSAQGVVHADTITRIQSQMRSPRDTVCLDDDDSFARSQLQGEQRTSPYLTPQFHSDRLDGIRLSLCTRLIRVTQALCAILISQIFLISTYITAHNLRGPPEEEQILLFVVIWATSQDVPPENICPTTYKDPLSCSRSRLTKAQIVHRSPSCPVPNVHKIYTIRRGATMPLPITLLECWPP